MVALWVQTLVSLNNSSFIVNQHWCPSLKAPAMMCLDLLSPGRYTHTHKEWHLERRASFSLMQISQSHCGWYRERAWTENGQQTWRKAEWHQRHQARVLFACQIITALKQCLRCQILLFPVLYSLQLLTEDIISQAKVTQNIPRSLNRSLPCFHTWRHTKKRVRGWGREGAKEQQRHRTIVVCILFYCAFARARMLMHYYKWRSLWHCATMCWGETGSLPSQAWGMRADSVAVAAGATNARAVCWSSDNARCDSQRTTCKQLKTHTPCKGKHGGAGWIYTDAHVHMLTDTHSKFPRFYCHTHTHSLCDSKFKVMLRNARLLAGLGVEENTDTHADHRKSDSFTGKSQSWWQRIIIFYF